MTELLADHIAPIIGNYSTENIARIRIFSHSGGYYTIGNMATVGGSDKVRDLCLLDSLYANMEQFDAYVQDNLSHFGVGLDDYRFSSVFSLQGGTYQNNIEMESRASSWVASAEDDHLSSNNTLFVDNTDAALTILNIESHSLLFKYTTISHEDIPKEYFYEFLVGAV